MAVDFLVTKSVLLTLGIFVALSWQMPEFVARIPNGNQIPHPCDRNQNWRAVGHENPAGGGPTNRFGNDFDQSGYQWTPELCRMDSDGDGMSNGQELGDPFCVWTTGALPSVQDRAQLSHPGVCEPINSGRCIGQNFFLTKYCPSGRPQTTTRRLALFIIIYLFQLILFYFFFFAFCFHSAVPSNRCAMPSTPANAYVVNNSPSQGGIYYVAGDFVQFECIRGFVFLPITCFSTDDEHFL